MSTQVHIENVQNLHLVGGNDAIDEALRGANVEGLGYGPAPTEDQVSAIVAEAQEATSPEAIEARNSEVQAQEKARDAQLDRRRIKLAERYEQESVDARARRNLLRNTASHADKSRGLEGFQTNHSRRPNNRSAVDTKQNSETLKAQESLLEACGRCAMSGTCKLEGNIDKWMDLHPYKSKRQDGDRRPGSTLPPHTTESRETFLGALEIDPLAHCDPRVRKSKPSQKAA